MDKKNRRRPNNEGSISLYADGQVVRALLRRVPRRTKKRKALYANSRKEVTNKLAQALAKRDDGVLFRRGPVLGRVHRMVAHHLEERQDQSHNLRELRSGGAQAHNPRPRSDKA